MSVITVNNKGTYGFDATALTGAGLTTSEATGLRTRVEAASALADAIRQALIAARARGFDEFNPADASLLALPVGLADSDREFLFANVMGRAYAGGPVSLDQWSRAVDGLAHWAGASASMLPPGAGGGSRNVDGIWYVNGQAWSVTELFTVNRVNTLAQMDRMTADSLNVIAANNQMAKALTGLMENLFKKYYENDWNSGYPPDRYVTKSWVDFVGTTDVDSIPDGTYYVEEIGDVVNLPNFWTDGSLYNHLMDGDTRWSIVLPELEYAVGFTQLRELADKYIGPSSMIAKMDSFDQKNDTYTVGLLQEDFRAMIDEVETIIGAFAADNQVAQLRNEALFSSRSNLVEGLSAFLRGQQTLGSTLARNA